MAEKMEKCAHEGCNCPAPAGGDYCSDECSFNEDDSDTGCNCGHAECAEKAVAVSHSDW
jgi:hypothetical protein